MKAVRILDSLKDRHIWKAGMMKEIVQIKSPLNLHENVVHLLRIGLSRVAL